MKEANLKNTSIMKLCKILKTKIKQHITYRYMHMWLIYKEKQLNHYKIKLLFLLGKRKNMIGGI